MKKKLKNKKKFGKVAFGVASSLVAMAPIASVMACGSDSSDKKDKNDATDTQNKVDVATAKAGLNEHVFDTTITTKLPSSFENGKEVIAKDLGITFDESIMQDIIKLTIQDSNDETGTVNIHADIVEGDAKDTANFAVGNFKNEYQVSAAIKAELEGKTFSSTLETKLPTSFEAGKEASVEDLGITLPEDIDLAGIKMTAGTANNNDGTLVVDVVIGKGASEEKTTFTVDKLNTNEKFVDNIKNALNEKLFNTSKNDVVASDLIESKKLSDFGIKDLPEGIDDNGISITSISATNYTRTLKLEVNIKSGDKEAKAIFTVKGFNLRWSATMVAQNSMYEGFMYETQDGTVYVGTKNDGLRKIDGNGSLVEITPALSEIDTQGAWMYQTKDGTIYVSGLGNDMPGLYKFENNGYVLVHDIDLHHGFMFESSNGTIYLGGNENGLMKLEGSNVVTLDGNVDTSWGNMVEANDGTIYMSTATGIYKIDGENHAQKMGGISVGTCSNQALTKGKDGTIYVLGDEAGLFKLDEANQTFALISDSSAKGGFVYTTMDGTIIFGSEKNGVLSVANDIASTLDGNDAAYGAAFLQTSNNVTYYGTSEGIFKIQ